MKKIILFIILISSLKASAWDAESAKAWLNDLKSKAKAKIDEVTSDWSESSKNSLLEKLESTAESAKEKLKNVFQKHEVERTPIKDVQENQTETNE